MKPADTLMGGKFTRIARAFTRSWGVEVVMGGLACCTDGKTIFIPANADFLEGADAMVLEGLLDHEWSHVLEEKNAEAAIKAWEKEGGRGPRPKTPLEVMRAEEDPRVRLLTNAFEDQRIERNSARKWPGVAEHLRAVQRHMVKLYEAKAPPPEAFWEQLSSAINFDAAGDSIAWAGKPVQDAVHGLLAEEVEAGAYTRNIEEVHELAKRVVEKIDAARDMMKEEDRARDEEKKDGPGSGGEGEKGSADDDEDSAPPPMSDRAALDEETRAALMASYDRAVKDDPLARVRLELEAAARKDAVAHGRYIPWPPALKGDHWHVPEVVSSSTADFQRIRDDVTPTIGALRARMNAVLRARAVRWLEGGKERGNIDPAALYSVRLGSKDVFAEPTPRIEIDTAIAVLVDLSGSMVIGAKSAILGGRYVSRVDFAKMTVAALGETLNPLGVPFEITAFDNDSAPDMTGFDAKIYSRWMCFRLWLIKGWNESWMRSRFRIPAIHAGLENVDGEALIFAARRLLERPETRRVLMVFSDGVPCGGCEHGQNTKNLHDAIAKIAHAGIELIGVGVQSPDVERFYRGRGVEGFSVADLDGLAPAVLRALKRRVVDGGKHGRRK